MAPCPTIGVDVSTLLHYFKDITGRSNQAD